MRLNVKKNLSRAALAAVSLAACGGASAAGFALIEQSGSGMGNAFAGGAAAAEDASTIFFNPAGMTQLPGKQFVIGVHGVKPSAKLSNEGSTATVGGPLRGGDGGDAGEWGFVPNLYLSWQLSQKWYVGLGVNAPFGLKTDYDAGWVGRYQGLKSELQSININPSVAYQVNDAVSLGAGFNAMYVDADLTKALDFGTICFGQLGPGPCTGLGLTPQNADGGQELKADAWGYGFNVGALFKLGSDMRIGIAYRSQVDLDLKGDSTYSGVPAAFAASPVFSNTSASADVTLPDSASISVYQQFGERWAMMGDITWTRWSHFEELRVKFDNGAPDNVTPENWDDSFRISLGLTYSPSSPWKLRGGIAWDQTPVSDEYRTVRIPDASRFWVAVGASYRFSERARVDFGYSHLFVDDASINKTETASGTVRGTYTNSVDILSLQAVITF